MKESSANYPTEDVISVPNQGSAIERTPNRLIHERNPYLLQHAFLGCLARTLELLEKGY